MKKHLLHLAAILFATSLAFVACRGGKDDPVNSSALAIDSLKSRAIHTQTKAISDNDIYVAGKLSYGYAKECAMLWKINATNTTSIQLGEINSWANSVFVSGDFVYAVGQENQRPTLWKYDGTKVISVALRSNHGDAYDVYVSDNIIYIAGSEETNNQDIATLWIYDGTNVTTRSLGSNIIPSMAMCLFVSKNDNIVYIGGGELDGNTTKPTLWKYNGNDVTVQRLSEEMNYISAISPTTDNIAYCIGNFNGDAPNLWKIDGSDVTHVDIRSGNTGLQVGQKSLYVTADNTVYIAAKSHFPLLLKYDGSNFATIKLDEKNAETSSVIMLDNIVYAVGTMPESGNKFTAKLWKYDGKNVTSQQLR